MLVTEPSGRFNFNRIKRVNIVSMYDCVMSYQLLVNCKDSSCSELLPTLFSNFLALGGGRSATLFLA